MSAPSATVRADGRHHEVPPGCVPLRDAPVGESAGPATFEGQENPLSTSPAFQQFVTGIGDRCAEPPVSNQGTGIGTYWGPG